MFLKHRKFLHWTSFAMAVLFLSMGLAWSGRIDIAVPSVTTTVTAPAFTEMEGLEETTAAAIWETNTTIVEEETETEAIMETTVVVNPTTAMTEEEAADGENIPTTTVVVTTFYSTEAAPPPSYAPSLLAVFLSRSLVALGILMGVAFVFLFPQKNPYLGPEAEGLLALLAIAYCAASRPYYFSGYMDIQWYLAMSAVLLICLRGIWSWIWNRFSLRWLLPHRVGFVLSKNMTRPQLYMLTHGLWIVLLSVLAAWFVFGDFGQRYLQTVDPESRPLLLLPLYLFLVLSVLSLVVSGRDARHLAEQVRALTEGRTVETSRSLYEREEAALASLQESHEEAVKTAVTSERFKVELISNVSHDLRTPLTSILGYGELLKKEELSDEGREQLNCLNQKAGYMKELVEELFELTKVSSGLMESKKESIDLIRLLEQTIGLADDQLTEAELTVRRHYPAEQLPIVTDGTRMHQVFANLLGNAIKYALKGTRIHLSVRDEGDSVVIRMSNIASYEMDFEPDEILQRFARGDKARSTQGSGLGLAIAQTYTESVGGHFRVEVDGDKFSAVTVLPKADRDL